MAILTNPLNIKKDGTIYACKCYTTKDEATPTTITGGSCYELKNNNTICYVGLYPTSVSGGNYHTPLKIKKGGVEYYVETQVVNTYTVTITQSSNQTIKVTCNGSTYTSTFTAPVGSAYTVTVTPSTGYTAGKPSSASGYVNSNITITASAASKKTYTVTITQSTGQTIKVVCNGTTYTSTFTANYGDTWTASLTASTGYNVGTLEATSGTITGATTIKAKTNATIKKFTVTITQSANQTITVVCGGITYTSTFTANYGSTYTASVTASTGYTAGTISSSSGTITSNITISATTATQSGQTYQLTVASRGSGNPNSAQPFMYGLGLVELNSVQYGSINPTTFLGQTIRYLRTGVVSIQGNIIQKNFSVGGISGYDTIYVTINSTKYALSWAGSYYQLTDSATVDTIATYFTNHLNNTVEVKISLT